MEIIIVVLVVVVIGLLIANKKKKKSAPVAPATPVAPTPPPAPVSGPCDDKRDGTNFRAYMTQSECNKHGYFWCPIAKACMPSSVNVNDCGKPAHLM